MKVFLIVTSVVIVIALVTGLRFSRWTLESPGYLVVKQDGAFEIREYPEMVVVSTSMDDTDPNDSTSFMRLFRYISGDNENDSKIAMTTPVFTSGAGGSGEMSFVVPKEVVADGAPSAINRMVKIDTVSAGRFAVYRFNGAWDLERFELSKNKLKDWMRKHQINAAAEPIVANYDPPFTPSFLKRNEILVRL